MRKFKYILINVGLVIIFIILLIFIYRSLKNDNVNQSKIRAIDYVYTCEQYNKKWYAEKKDNTGGVRCHKFQFYCEDCEISPTYIENRLIYYKDYNVYLYDTLNKKVIKEMTNRYDTVRFLFQNNEVYGFNYVELDNKNYIYNLKTDLAIKIDGDICNSNCKIESDDNNLVFDDRIIIQDKGQYNILNLDTGKYEMKEKNNIYRRSFYECNSEEECNDFFYYIMPYNSNDDNSLSLFDSKLNILFKNSNEDSEIYNAINLEYLSDNMILVDNKSNYVLSNNDGILYENFKLSIDDINDKIYSLIEDESLKNQIEKDQIISDENFSMFSYYDKQEGNVNFDINYSNQFYETYIYFTYRYNINDKTTEIIMGQEY